MILGVIQARMGSTRLPNKVLLDLAGKPSLLWIYERMRQAKLLDKVVVSTSLSSKDDAIEEFCLKQKIDYFRGEEEDLLDRLYQTGVFFNADHLVRVTGDCPLVDPQIIDQLIRFYLDYPEPLDYASNNLVPSYPHGLDVEIFRFSTFQKIWQEVKDPDLRALAGAYIYAHPEKFRLASVKCPRDLSRMRVTLDYEEDLILLRTILGRFKGTLFTLKDLEALFEREPELFSLNDCRKGHTKSWDVDKYLEKKGR